MRAFLLLAFGLSCHTGRGEVPALNQPTGIENLLDAWKPGCSASTNSPDSLLDFDRMCAGDLCAHDTYQAIVSKLGPPDEPTCRARYMGTCSLTWSQPGVAFEFNTDDALPSQKDRPVSMELLPSNAYRTEEGVGIGQPINCLAGVDGIMSMEVTSYNSPSACSAIHIRRETGTVDIFDHTANGTECNGRIGQIYLNPIPSDLILGRPTIPEPN